MAATANPDPRTGADRVRFSRVGTRIWGIVSGLAYGPPAALAAVAVAVLAPDSPSVEGMLAIIAVPVAIAMVMGAFVHVEARADGLRVVNRWRRTTVPWDQIRLVRSSVPSTYLPLLFTSSADDSTGGGTTDLRAFSVATVDRRTAEDPNRSRVGLPLMATMFTSLPDARLEALLDAIADHAVEIDLGRDRPAYMDELTDPTDPADPRS
jgi:hypothetical protein